MRKQREIISYLIFGVLTTLINIITFWLFNDFMSIDYKISTTIAWAVSVVFAYITNKLLVFKSRGNSFKQIFKEFSLFMSARVFSYFIDLFLMIYLIEVLTMNELWAKILVNVVVVIFNYIASKFLIFKTK